MDINLSVYNESAIRTFGTCTIPLVSSVNGCKSNTKFYIADCGGSILFNCEDLLYIQLVQPHPLVSKSVPPTGYIISSNHDKAYRNFVNRNKNSSHYKAAQCSVPKQAKFTPKQINFKPHNLEQIKEKYGDIFEGLGKFPGEPYHINLDPAIPPKRVPCRPVPIHQQEELKWQLT